MRAGEKICYYCCDLDVGVGIDAGCAAAGCAVVGGVGGVAGFHRWLG